MCVRLRCSRSVKLCVAAREPGCLNVVRQFLITWPSARAAAEWLTTILEHYWRKQKERRGDGTRAVTEEEDEERWRSKKKKEGMRRGKSYRKRKHRQYWWLLGWVCSKNWLYWSTLHCDFQWLQSKKSNRISQIWLLFLYGKWRNFEVFHPFAMNREWSFKALKRIIMCPIKN